MSSLLRQLNDYRLTTAEILYHLPDHPALLQTYIWQDYDLAPRFPELRRFLDFWTRELDGPIHSVRLAHAALMSGMETVASALGCTSPQSLRSTYCRASISVRARATAREYQYFQRSIWAHFALTVSDQHLRTGVQT